ncbi:putative Metal dependent phosphohydrolase (HD domain protein) [Desulfamplus magnetovallimortis]|uniref:Putative Metal dependent phosphohydrolase (HD domain protein) n=1 Tax=Desulfamplus magnetovallimortis TaxID=1246637 RepID=A0A1W1HBJ1_9BACT|nr:HDOD domain-containing protein [Desulfamplus magnetovallimortis]SLM29809.1 putative Metal dependent phosphohydrolase (HD domain protein) [Desulfamplus magnetovallimortis]
MKSKKTVTDELRSSNPGDINMPYKNIMADIIAQEIIDSGIKIPSLPSSAEHLMKMVQQPVDKIDIIELEKLVERDPVLFAQILNLANSPYYGTGIEITGLRTALMRIGLSESIFALYMYLFKSALPPFPDLSGFSDKEFWEESWACAIANRRLGDPRLLVESLPGELYISGLLQGIGKLILAVYDPAAFNKCIAVARKTGTPLHEAEFKIFKTTGGLLASKILASWHLPEKICAAVAYWPSPEFADPEYREIAALTQFACSIVRLSGLVETCENTPGVSTSSALADLSNTYLLKNGSSSFASTGKQYKIVQEIVSLLENHFDLVNKEKSENSPDKNRKEKNIKNEKKRSLKRETEKHHGFTENSDFFSWVRAFFK